LDGDQSDFGWSLYRQRRAAASIVSMILKNTLGRMPCMSRKSVGSGLVLLPGGI
jgi:hypothetical protein